MSGHCLVAEYSLPIPPRNPKSRKPAITGRLPGHERFVMVILEGGLGINTIGPSNPHGFDIDSEVVHLPAIR